MVPVVSALAFKAALFPALVLVSWVKSMRFMALTSIGANVLLAYACAAIFGVVFVAGVSRSIAYPSTYVVFAVYLGMHMSDRASLPVDAECSDSLGGNGTLTALLADDGAFAPMEAACLRVPAPRAFTGWFVDFN